MADLAPRTSLYEPPFVVKEDPPLGDGCAYCHGPRITTRNKAIDGTQVPNGVWLAHVEKDPFCSSECCRSFHDCSLEDEEAERRGRCADCGKPHHWARNTNAGPRCAECERIVREQRHFDDPAVCACCGGHLDEKTPGCRRCQDRHRRRQRRAADPALRERHNAQHRARRLAKKSRTVAVPHLVEPAPLLGSEDDVSGEASGTATPPVTSTRKAA